MSIQNNLSLNAVPESGNWGALPDTATIGSEWTDLSRLRQLAGSFCPQEAQQIASQIIPDDLNLESVFASFTQLQNPVGIGTGGFVLPDYHAGLPFTDDLSKLFFPDSPQAAKQNDLSSAAESQFADTTYSDYSFFARSGV